LVSFSWSLRFHAPTFSNSGGDVLVTKMSRLRRLSKLEYEKVQATRRVRKRDKVVILRQYEEAMAKGGNRDDILEKLGKKYDRSERQIERYIQQARVEAEGKPGEQVSPVRVTEDRARTLMLHSEAIRKAIGIWVEKQHPPSHEELRGACKGKLDAWGVVAEMTADGHGSAGPAIGKHPLYDSLRQHLVPPVTRSDFWTKVGELTNLGLGFLSGAVAIHSELTRLAEQESGCSPVPGNWQDKPATGITQDFVQTLYEHVLGITDMSRWSHSIWAGLWPVTGGLIVTWTNEGVRLLQRLGLDPFIQEIYWPLNGKWMLPRHPRERIAYGDANLNVSCTVAFLLCFGTNVIAMAFSAEELIRIQEVHRAMLTDFDSGQKTSSLRRTRERLDSLSQEVRTALEFAQCETSFAGKCAFCP
jgi:hypothetical protein